MENFVFYSPTYFLFGKDTENQAGDLVRRFGGSKVLIHYGEGSVVRTGLLDRVKDSLKTAGLDYVELGGVKPNPRAVLSMKALNCAEKKALILYLLSAAAVRSIRPNR